MKIKFDEASAIEGRFVRENVFSTDELGVGLEVQLLPTEDLDSLVASLQTSDTHDIYILDDSGSVQSAYSGYKMTTAFKNYVNDTDSGFAKHIVVRFKKDSE